MNTKKNVINLLFFVLIILFSNSRVNAQNVGIGTTSFTPDASAILELKSTNQGLLPPRMTTAERNAIQSPATGLQIFNLTTNCLEICIGSYWHSIFCGCGSPPTLPSSGSHIPSETQIIWNWNSVSGADGYKYSLVNDYATANDIGMNTTYTRQGLECGTSYTLYVWAYNFCGNSSALTLTQSTTPCPICNVPSVTFTYNGQQVTYGTVESSGECWLDRNLGATQVATGCTDVNAYGDLFQWGRAADGHQNRNSSTTNTLSSSNTPGHSNMILVSISPFDWRSPQNNSLWQGLSGINNPCPSGWRIPTETEWNTERLSWGANNNSLGAFSSPLKLSLAGNRGYSDGAFYNVGAFGAYWSSTVDVNSSKNLFFGTTSAAIYTFYRAYGFSVRCIKD